MFRHTVGVEFQLCYVKAAVSCTAHKAKVQHVTDHGEATLHQ